MLLLNTKNLLFYDIMEEWLSFHALCITESTVYNYRKVISCLQDNIGSVRLKEITQTYLQDFFLNCSDRGFATNTIINFSKVIKQSLDYATAKGYIKKCPYTNIKIPKKAKSDITPFTVSEVEKLLCSDMPLWVRDGIQIAFRTGMRKGEIYALQVSDVNFEKNFLTVKHTQTLDKNGNTILGSPKTNSSIRRIDFDNVTFQILSRRCQNNDTGFLFSRNGEMLIPYNISNILKRKCIDSGIVPRRFHDLRHAHATYLLINNVHPKIVQERLGHANISITLDTYSHLIPGLQQTAVQAIEKLNF